MQGFLLKRVVNELAYAVFVERESRRFQAVLEPTGEEIKEIVGRWYRDRKRESTLVSAKTQTTPDGAGSGGKHAAALLTGDVGNRWNDGRDNVRLWQRTFFLCGPFLAVRAGQKFLPEARQDTPGDKLAFVNKRLERRLQYGTRRE